MSPKGNSGGGQGGGGGRGQGQGGGGGRGQGSGQGGGRGMGRGGRALGPSGKCVCPNCGETVQHQQGVTCLDVNCPKCGHKMIRE